MDPTSSIGGYIRALSLALSADMHRSNEQHGLTSAQGLFLHHLWYRQEHLRTDTYAKDLEREFGIKHPTVSGILQRMEAAGFVTFEERPQDRRCKAIRLTQKAVDAHAQIAEHIRQTEARLVANMSEEDAQTLRRLLHTALDNFGGCQKPCFPDHEKEVSQL